MFIRLLTGLVNSFNHTKCISLSNQKFESQPTLIILHPNEYSQELHYYSFKVKLDRCVGSRNTLNDLSNKAFVPNKKEDLNISVFNMITGINELKTLRKIFHANVNVNLMEENVTQVSGGITINVDVSLKNITYLKKTIFGILLYVVAKMVNI